MATSPRHGGTAEPLRSRVWAAAHLRYQWTPFMVRTMMLNLVLRAVADLFPLLLKCVKPS